MIALFLAVTVSAQKKQKIRGSKVVTETEREIETFTNLEVEDNLEVFLMKGDQPHIKIETDDNLHEVINTEVYSDKLRISTTKNIKSAKIIKITITYTDELSSIIAKHESSISAIESLKFDTIAIESYDYAKLYINAISNDFSLSMDGKSEAELNVESDHTKIVLSKSTQLKALINTQDANIDLYQDAEAKLEGGAANATLRLDNKAEFEGQNFTVKELTTVAEGFSNCSVTASEKIIITANGESETQIYGNPEISITKFEGKAVLRKSE